MQERKPNTLFSTMLKSRSIAGVAPGPEKFWLRVGKMSFGALSAVPHDFPKTRHPTMICEWLLLMPTPVFNHQAEGWTTPSRTAAFQSPCLATFFNQTEFGGRPRPHAHTHTHTHHGSDKPCMIHVALL